MALNPNIPLSVGVPRNVDVGHVFGNALLNAGRFQDLQTAKQQQPLRNRLLEAQTEQAETGVKSQKQLQEFTSIAMGAAEVVPFLESGDIDGAMNVLTQRRDRIISEGGDPSNTMGAIEGLQSDPNKLLEGSRQILSQAQQFGIMAPTGSGKGQPAPTASARDFDTFNALKARAQETGDPADAAKAQQFGRQAGFDRVTPQEQADIDVREEGEKAQARADVELSTVGAIQAEKLKQVRSSAIKQEMSTRNRDSARESIRLNKALKLAEKADQGLTGAVTIQMARLFPSIDASNEAALSQSLTQLALDQLQKFKGPTTDFEFGIAESIGGRLSDSASANKAKLRSLQRASWFNQREFKQFSQHVAAGGDPDAFAFNFGESIKTKKGVFTLQDIQDTAADKDMSIEETLKLLNK